MFLPNRGEDDVTGMLYLSWDLRGGYSFLWQRLWGPGVNPRLCRGVCLRRLLSHHTFVALRLITSEKPCAEQDATMTVFYTHVRNGQADNQHASDCLSSCETVTY